MRIAWLLAGLLLFAGCAQDGPAPAPEEGGAGGDASPSGPTEGTDDPDGGDANASEPEGSAEEDEATVQDEEQATPEEPAMEITSPAFDDNTTMPVRYTADGEDVSPPLNVSGVPSDTETLALIVDDPDAPREDPWVHWLIWDIPAAADAIPEGYPPSGDGKAFDQARQGNNSFSSDNQRYRGPAPPEGHGEHRYRFTLFALDATLDLAPGANRTQLEAAMDGHVLDQARLTGLYER